MTKITRRKFMGTAGMTMAGSIMIPRFSLSYPKKTRELFMHNIHTGEYLKTTYCEEGVYVSGALKEINVFFRDRLSNTVKSIHPQLLDLIHVMYQETGSSKPLELVSGYRCPETNSALRGKSKGVATKSYHMQGMAADFYIPGVKLCNLKKLACSKGAGGVGYYPGSGFLHVDVREGPKKRW